jgi:hypothetical protein
VFGFPVESWIAKFILIFVVSIMTTFRTNFGEFGSIILGHAATTSLVANMKVIAYPSLDSR